MDRYHRQTLLPQIGPIGQARLAAARVAIIGCGALGTVAAELLARAGVGYLKLIDRDLVELTNLQRQTLFDEADARDAVPKAAAAARRIGLINSAVTVEPVVVDVHSGNIESPLADRIDLIIDGTDNADTRYLINDVAIKLNRPWVYGAAIGVEGRAMLVVPGVSPCLRCVFPDPPAAGELPTCDTAGVLAGATFIIGSIQATLAIQRLVDPSKFDPSLSTIDLWPMRFRNVNVADARRSDCPACGERKFEFLNRPAGASQTTLCGQNAVQIRGGQNGVKLDLAELERRLKSAGPTQRSSFLLRCEPDDAPGIRVTIFTDGRAIIHGTTDFTRARSLYARFVGV
ncbi:ThiF family adenylyltransferase [soil metagenome]